MLETETSNLFGGFAKNGASAALRPLNTAELTAAIAATVEVWKSSSCSFEGNRLSFSDVAKDVFAGINALRQGEYPSEETMAELRALRQSAE